ncbi:transposase, partial [Streptomyces sp. NPDC059153]|uniref:transposase n=1 Tax=Streptomyces sp. NPDC059153 TaxID=3346743 RepID=UPI0036A6738F
PKKNRTRFLEFCRYLRSLYPPEIRIAIVLDNFSPHLTTKKDARVGDWASASNVEFVYTPTNSSWLNRIEAQFTALRYFALDGTDHASHSKQSGCHRRGIRLVTHAHSAVLLSPEAKIESLRPLRTSHRLT